MRTTAPNDPGSPTIFYGDVVDGVCNPSITCPNYTPEEGIDVYLVNRSTGGTISYNDGVASPNGTLFDYGVPDTTSYTIVPVWTPEATEPPFVYPLSATEATITIPSFTPEYGCVYTLYSRENEEAEAQPVQPVTSAAQFVAAFVAGMTYGIQVSNGMKAAFSAFN